MLRCRRGFTLIELVLVIVLAGLVAVMVATVMARPLQGFAEQSRRAELTEQAAGALNRMARDIRQAVPNTLREVDGQTLEWLPIEVAGRYRANRIGASAVRHDPPACSGEPSGLPCRIPLLGPDLDAAKIEASRWMIVYNLGAGSGVSLSPGSVSPAAEMRWDGSELVLSGSALAGFAFRYASPQHRFYLAREVVRYRCENPGGSQDGQGRLWREVSDSLDFQLARRALLADRVAACSFDYSGATHERNALVTLKLVLLAGGERVSLLQQVHVDNAP